MRARFTWTCPLCDGQIPMEVTAEPSNVYSTTTSLSLTLKSTEADLADAWAHVFAEHPEEAKEMHG